MNGIKLSIEQSSALQQWMFHQNLQSQLAYRTKVSLHDILNAASPLYELLIALEETIVNQINTTISQLKIVASDPSDLDLTAIDIQILERVALAVGIEIARREGKTTT